MKPFRCLQSVFVFVVIFVMQLVLFANSKSAFTSFIQQNQATFSNIFIVQPEDPDGDDPLPNPIRTLYTHEHLEEQVNFTINRVSNSGNFIFMRLPVNEWYLDVAWEE